MNIKRVLGSFCLICLALMITEIRCKKSEIGLITRFIEIFRTDSPIKLIEKVGFQAESHDIRVDRHRAINLIKIINPEITNSSKRFRRNPVLFIHGLFATSACFLIAGHGGHPEDLSNENPKDYDDQTLVEAFSVNKAFQSMPLMLSMFGYEVWLINRRPTFDSILASWRSKPRPDETNKASGFFSGILRDFLGRENYWDFSFDEQAEIDLPLSIDYILEESGKDKINLIGHSAGGQLVLMLPIVERNYSLKGEYQ